MTNSRYLCSDLLKIRGPGGWRGFANLEEIWNTGAILEAEEPIPAGQKLLLRNAAGKIWGEVVKVEAHEFGFRVELAFFRCRNWTPEVFRPRHLFNPDSLKSDDLKPEGINAPPGPKTPPTAR